MRIIADDRTNSLIVLASEVFANRVREFVALLDRDIPQGESKMHVFRLQYANSEDLSKVLMNLPSKEARPAAAAPGQPAPRRYRGLRGKIALLSSDVQIVSDKATNTLIITANKEDWRILEEVIRKVDVARSMVYIEALIMEVDVNKNFQIGVEWRAVKDLGTLSGFDTGRAAAIRRLRRRRDRRLLPALPGHLDSSPRSPAASRWACSARESRSAGSPSRTSAPSSTPSSRTRACTSSRIPSSSRATTRRR